MSDIYGYGEDVPPLRTVRAASSPTSRFFIPVGPSMEKIGPSQALKATPPAPPHAPQAVASAAGTSKSEVDTLMQDAFKLWNDSVESGERQRKLDELSTMLKGYGVAAGAPPSSTEPSPAALAQPQAAAPISDAPAPGTYEQKNRAWESSGSDTAVNRNTGAAGRYQFMPSTAEGLRKQFPNENISDNWRTNPEDQEKLMRLYTTISRDSLKKTLARDPTGGELYALHLFGHGKGPSIVQGGNRPLTELTSAEERRVNPFLNNYKTAAELMAFFNRKFG
jgi:hypothetical protein